MCFILSLIIVCTSIFLVVYIIGILIEYACTVENNIPKIKFDAFKKFYSINPERWELRDEYAVCWIDIERENVFYGGLFYDYTKEKFRFGFWDYQRYKRFCSQIKKDKLNAEKMKGTAKMLKMVKKDIANMENLAEQQKKQAMENFDSILKI